MVYSQTFYFNPRVNDGDCTEELNCRGDVDKRFQNMCVSSLSIRARSYTAIVGMNCVGRLAAACPYQKSI
jgi:hypothetical protein